MEIIEKFIRGKYENQDLCEDAIVVAEHHLAVIDGATSKSNKKINNKSAGKAIADCIKDYLESSAGNHSGNILIKELSKFIAANLLTPNDLTVKDANSPSASVAIYSMKQGILTIVGDVSFSIESVVTYRTSRFDKVMSEVRSVVNLIEGNEQMINSDGKWTDVGREFILPILEKQHEIRNSSDESPWCYGNIDGFEVPSKFITELAIQEGQEIILFSDGYPRIEKDLLSTETLLHHILLEDPLQTKKYISTKGKYSDMLSFDDRSFLKFIA